MFKLLRHFSIASFLSIVAAVVALALLYRSTTVASITAAGNASHQAVTQMVGNALWPEIRGSLREFEGLSAQAMRRHPRTQQLDAAIRQWAKRTSILKIKIFSLDGRTIYSTEPGQLGVFENEPGFALARQGRTVTEISYRDHFSAIDGVLDGRQVLSSYVPLQDPASGRIEAAFEIYSDVTPFMTSLTRSQVDFMMRVALILLGLYSALFLIVRRADGILRRQHAQSARQEAEIKRARDDLEVRVHGRTQDLEQLNSQLRMEVAERGRVEAALRDSREQLSLAIEGSSRATFDWDIAANRVRLSEVWSEMLGGERRLSEMTFAELESLIHPDDAPAVGQAIRAAFKGTLSRYRVEHRVRTRDGRWIWIESHGMVIERDAAGRAVRMAGTNADITARKSAEEALKASEERYRYLFEASPQPMWIVDSVTLRFLAVNDAALAMYGYSSSDFMRMTTADLRVPEERARFLEFLQRDGHDQPFRGEWRHVTRDGTAIDVAVSARPIAYAGREARLVLATDVTARKRAQDELEKAKAVAEAATRAKSQFLANMSHEIRTPMNGVLGMVELLLDTPLTEPQRRFADTIHRSGLTLLGVINDILDFSKIEAGRLQLESVPFDLRQTVGEVAELLAEHAHRKGLELAYQVDDETAGQFLGDALRLRQILTNLVTNAIKFTPGGEVVIRIRSESAEPGRSVLRFSVTDTGVGISEEARQRLFEPFSQGDSSTSRRYGGTGLGLAICRQLVQMMRGTIGAQSVPGKGSEFWFTVELPVAPADHNPVAAVHKGLEGLRLLVVDDNETNRRILEHYAAAAHLAVNSAADGAEGLEELRRAAGQGQPYHLAVVDMKMPVMNGFELTRAAMADPLTAGVRIVVLSSLARGDDGAGLRQAGAVEQLTKPVNRIELYRALARAARIPRSEIHTLPGAARPVPPAGLGARVLVVEDNAVNQQVTAAMLEALGCTLRHAGNGREALRELASERPDVILMDCQMPEMDGFDATRAIRAGETGGMHVPIIALTANAMEGDRERCLECGMDDYLTKPFTRNALAAALTRWIPEPAPDVASVRAAPGPEPGTTPAASLAPVPACGTLDTEALDRIRALQRDGSPALLSRVVGIYFGDSARLIEALKQAAASADAPALARAAHTLKSSSASVGAVQVAEYCLALETAARKGEVRGTPELIQRIEREHGAVCILLETEAAEARPRSASTEEAA